MVTGLLGTAPTASALDAGETGLTGRALALDYWAAGGPGVKEAAERALLGTDGDIEQFLADKGLIQQIDDRVDVSRIINAGGPSVREAAMAALQGTPADVQAFLAGGWKAPHQMDQRVETSKAINFGGVGVKEAGEAALRGTPEDVEHFLEDGQYAARHMDDRVQVSKIHNSGGPNIKAAAELALQGTYDDLIEFLEVGQFVARNRDQEHATIAQLTEQAKQAGKQAEDATKSAEEASARAVAASELAKQAAQKAAQETEAAKNDATRAAIKSKQAADAARAAAEAAQTAIGAANAANRSAKIAALAAAQTANAAAAAADAANRAYTAAIAAGTDKNQAANANTQAKAARAAANLATESAKAAEQAGKASLAAATAAAASKNASGNADLAADAADEAAGYADAAGASSAEARAAAAETRRHANEANRAATAAETLARKSATAANEARDAANSAATHANNAATAAEYAAAHAGEAANHAAEATKQANAAKVASDAATAAVATAKKTFDIAREVEAEELTTRTAAAIERAKTHKTTGDTFVKDVAATVVEGKAIEDDTKALAGQLDQPGADTTAIAASGRKVALRAMKHFGSWRQEAAAQALSGTNEDVLEYLRSGWKTAQQSEIRQQVADLASNSPYEAVRTAATEALTGTDAQIADFYTTGQHEVAGMEYRVLVSKIHNEGGVGVKEAAEAALADGSTQALLKFINNGQHAARHSDERVAASKLFNDGGPEVKAAAMVALSGPADELHYFIQAGQYVADRKDELASNHVAQVQRLIAEGGVIAAKALQNRWLAAKAAAEANQAAAEAAAAATEAQKSATQAAQYATQADAAADDAATSATQAAASATTARNAAKRAEQDAIAAEESAAQAEFSASYARSSALRAQDAKVEARTAALDAGKSAEEAEASASQAWDQVVQLRETEEAAARRQAEEQRAFVRDEESKPSCIINIYRDHLPPCAMAPDNYDIVVPRADPASAQLAMDLFGITDAIACVEDPTLAGCLMAGMSLLPIGKIKVLDKALDGVEGIASGTRTAQQALKCFQCFLAGTKVLMADNSVRNIESVTPGDQVVATDPHSGETGPGRVSNAIFTEHDKNFNELTIRTGRGEERLIATHEHPFWSPSENAWIDAGDLRLGMTLRTIDGSTAAVQWNRSFDQRARTYTLTVEAVHTFYVFAGTTPVLVHNASCPVGFRNLGGDRFESPGGLIYGPGSTEGHRIAHVMEHTRPNPSKPTHSVFKDPDQAKVLGLLDEGWAKRGAPDPSDPARYVVPMGREIGTAGERNLRIVVVPGTNRVITAFPQM
ncbi:polymorphic toxin-type HINT domain-containing protein [Streptomyces sp. NPDC056527]|uniref:polymorphic toxin-type HINT domain-containing protein n=1 Tax=Streptomyces sp. NPDC056527 TaxID=3345853 RepID=UPI0036C2D2FB